MALAPGTLLAGVAGGIAFPILPLVALRHGLSLGFIGVILAANRAMRVVFSPWIGIYADRYGGRRTLLAGLLLQTVVLALYALGVVTHHVGSFFLLGRLLHGPASACVFIAAQALALHAGGPAHSGQAAAMVRVAIVLGVPLGLSAGGCSPMRSATRRRLRSPQSRSCWHSGSRTCGCPICASRCVSRRHSPTRSAPCAIGVFSP